MGSLVARISRGTDVRRIGIPPRRLPGISHSREHLEPDIRDDIDGINRAPEAEIGKTEPMDTENFAQYFDHQADGCERDGSPIYAAIMRACARDVVAGGAVADLLKDWEGHALLDAVGMRILGAVHRLVLRGELPELAAHYPSMNGQPEFPKVEECFLEAVASSRERIVGALDEQVQTNEVRRSAVLLGGFLEIAAQTQLPFRQLELGASAGLNHIWDQYRYALGSHRWGRADADPLLETVWSGPAPRLDARIDVIERAACDLSPVDIHDDEAALRLDSFIWPDQPDRRKRFQQAASRVRQSQVVIDASPALPWLKSKLAEPVAGCVTVVFHSIFWQYMPREDRREVRREFERAGAAATEDAPLAWLRMEARTLDVGELELTLWTGSGEPLHAVLAECGFHGQFIDWKGL